MGRVNLLDNMASRPCSLLGLITEIHAILIFILPPDKR